MRGRSEFPELVPMLEKLITSGVADKIITNAGVKTSDAYSTDRNRRKRQKLDSQKGFKEVETYLLKKHALKMIKPFMVVQGLLYDKVHDGVVVLIKTIYSRDSTEVFLENLDKLKIYATCQNSELEDGSTDPGIGDLVKAAILKVDQHTDDVYITMRNDVKRVHLLGICHKQRQALPNNPPSPRQMMGLSTNSGDAFDVANESEGYGGSTPNYNGLVSPAYAKSAAYSPAYNPSPFYGGYQCSGNNFSYYSYAPSPSYSTRVSQAVLDQKGKAWLDKIGIHPLYRNPHGHNLMIHAFNIPQYCSGLAPNLREYKEENNYKTLRANQNKQWARKSLEQGVGFAKKGKQEKALSCYDHALEIDGDFTDALVAKAALLANAPLKKYAESVSLLEKALKIDPLTENALKYLEKVLELQDKETAANQMPPADTHKLLERVSDKSLQKLKLQILNVA